MVHPIFDAASRRRARHDHKTHACDEARGGYGTPGIDELLPELSHPAHRSPTTDQRDPLDHWWEGDDERDSEDTRPAETPKSSCPPDAPSCSDCKWCSDPEGDVEGCVVVRIASALEDIAMVLGHISRR